jgi:hypothetical protein
MKTDVKKYIPFEKLFVLDIFHFCVNKAKIDKVEAEILPTLKTLGINDYNVMKGNPNKDTKFNYLCSKKI